jgi:hypothetical protein
LLRIPTQKKEEVVLTKEDETKNEIFDISRLAYDVSGKTNT